MKDEYLITLYCFNTFDAFAGGIFYWGGSLSMLPSFGQKLVTAVYGRDKKYRWKFFGNCFDREIIELVLNTIFRPLVCIFASTFHKQNWTHSGHQNGIIPTFVLSHLSGRGFLEECAGNRHQSKITVKYGKFGYKWRMQRHIWSLIWVRPFIRNQHGARKSQQTKFTQLMFPLSLCSQEHVLESVAIPMHSIRHKRILIFMWDVPYF